MRIFALLLVFIPACYLNAQDFEPVYERITFTDSLPSVIRSKKSAVILDIPGSQKEVNRVAQALHEQLAKGGIDAVAYYEISLLYAGREVTRSFIKDFAQREISSLIWLKYEGESSKLAVTGIDEGFLLGTSSIKGWKKEGDFKVLARDIYVLSANSGYTFKNFLINELVEWGPYTNPISGNRGEYFTQALRTRKLAVPRTGNLQRDFLLENALKEHYPYEFELVDPGLTDEQLEKGGFQFVIGWVEGRQDQVRQLLGYDIKPGVSSYPAMIHRKDRSQVKPIELGQTVSKFFIRDLRSGEFLLGGEWDADTRWIDGLVNYIYSYRKQYGI